ncbi:MAG: NTP transferase domain-containing protein [Oscillospiraceae bacterium]
MNRVKRAIIMAAGKGERMKPLTLTTPKPLVRVNGQRMIDSVIGALHRNGIHEIYVVVGYHKECFAALPAEYPGLTLIENPWYDRCNNISSLYVAREHIGEAIILDGDQLIHDDTALAPEFERSGYNAVWTEEPTQEWLLTLDEAGVVTGCSRTGGDGGWRLVSISRWSADDGKRLREYLEKEFESGNRQIYWDDVALFCHPEAFALGIRPMAAEAEEEIDTLAELAAADPTYKTYLEELSK